MTKLQMLHKPEQHVGVGQKLESVGHALSTVLCGVCSAVLYVPCCASCGDSC